MVSKMRMLLGLIFAVALCVGSTPNIAHAQTSGSISAQTSDTSDPMQADWIGCVIFFHGKAHACSLSGLQVPVSGVAQVSGVVNNVKNFADVAGTYKVVGEDATYGKGHLQVKNDKGVTMTLWAFTAYTDLVVGSDGMKVGLK